MNINVYLIIALLMQNSGECNDNKKTEQILLAG